MAIHGQRTPITVRKSAARVEQPWTLIVGMHRLNGAIIENLPTVVALERIGGTAADALDEEASENLDRRDQPPLERAIFINATCEAARARLGNASQYKLGAKARWAKVKTEEIKANQALQDESDDAADIMSAAYGWQEEVAAAFGRSKRDIRRALTIYRMLVEPFPDLTQALSDHPVVGNNQAQLLELAAIERTDLRKKAIELLLADRELSADEAIVQAGISNAAKPSPHDHQKHWNAIKGGWNRLSIGHQKRFIPDLASMLHTQELKRLMRDRLNEELGDV
ncbi:MAG: hypothetical protein U9R07_15730 [Pseudomonadota bacterium]|nr:hypothetical protein [Pseudomonadota bacterium]